MQDPIALEITQDPITAEMAFGVASLIGVIAGTMILEPSDIIAPGPPAGVGSARDPRRFFEDGDRVTDEIDAIGGLDPVRRP